MKQNRIIGIIGCKGAGKSFEAKKRFRGSGRVIVFDSLAEYDTGLFIDGSNEQQRAYMCDFLKRAKFRVCFRPRSGEDAVREDFDLVCRAAFAAGDCTFIVEEADLYCSANYAEPGLDRLVRYGRHRSVSIIYTTRRFQEISRNLTAQTDAYVLFRVAEPRDLELIAKRFGQDTADDVSRLKKFKSIEIEVSEIGQGGENESQERSDSSGVLRSDSVGSGNDLSSDSGDSSGIPDSTESHAPVS